MKLDAKTLWENVALIRSTIRYCLNDKVSIDTLTGVLEMADWILCDVEDELFNAANSDKKNDDA